MQRRVSGVVSLVAGGPVLPRSRQLPRVPSLTSAPRVVLPFGGATARLGPRAPQTLLANQRRRGLARRLFNRRSSMDEAGQTSIRHVHSCSEMFRDVPFLLRAPGEHANCWEAPGGRSSGDVRSGGGGRWESLVGGRAPGRGPKSGAGAVRNFAWTPTLGALSWTTSVPQIGPRP